MAGTDEPGTASGRPLVAGELVVLRAASGESLLLRLRPGPQTLEGRGILDLTEAIGAAPGVEVRWAGTRCRLFRPLLADRLAGLARRAQIITPKDAPQLLYLAGVGPGSVVAEVGAGSGALTIVLAHAVGPMGHVHSFDRRPEFLEVARGNVRRAGYEDRVTFVERDVAAEGFGIVGASSLLLDVAEPWSLLARGREALAPGGGIGVFTPTYNQLERTIRELRTLGFDEIRALEHLERGLQVGESATRPETEMLGHTGFLIGARWWGGPW